MKLSARGNCFGISANIASADGRTELIAALREREDALDVLVNNAGALWAAPLAEWCDA